VMLFGASHGTSGCGFLCAPARCSPIPSHLAAHSAAGVDHLFPVLLVLGSVKKKQCAMINILYPSPIAGEKITIFSLVIRSVSVNLKRHQAYACVRSQ
jgi:hypothetical protein